MGKYTDKEKAIHCFQLLNMFVLDLIGAARLMDLIPLKGQKLMSNHTKLGVFRMRVSYFVITLDKIRETLEAYSPLFKGPKYSGRVRDYKNWVKQVGIYDLRNKVLAHIHCNKENRPLTNSEIVSYLDRIMDHRGSEKFFQEKINNPSNQSDTIVGLVEGIRDELINNYGLSAEELKESA